MNSKIAYYAILNPTDTSAEAPALPRVIPGSMPCVDTPFDFGENTLVVDVLAEPELNEALAALVPLKVDASELASMIKVSNVTDVATMRIGEIRGTDEFIITGNGVTLDAAGESAKLVDRKTGAELATAEVVTVSKGQSATCAFGSVEGGIARGQYWLVVTTFGLVGDTTPRVFRKPVTLVEPIPAPVPKATLRFYPTAGEAKAGGGEPITATVTVEKSELTENMAHILTPFCEPMYADVYGTVTLEDDATRGEVQMVPKE